MNVEWDLRPASQLSPGSYPPAIRSTSLQNTEAESTITVRPLPKTVNTPSTSPAAASSFSDAEAIRKPKRSVSSAQLEGKESICHEIDAADQGNALPIRPTGTLESPVGQTSAVDTAATTSRISLAKPGAKPSSGGVHRFTFVNQTAIKNVDAVKGKKQSACSFHLRVFDSGLVLILIDTAW